VKQVFEFFDTHLHEKWEIYIQPYLNGLRPDFILLHERLGIAVFEVEEWGPDVTESQVETQNPVQQLHIHKQEIIDLYCPRLARRAGKDASAVITTGIICPNADRERVKELLKPCLKRRKLDNDKYERYHPISGRDTLESGNLSTVFPEGFRQPSKYMNPDLAKDLRHWLVEPDFSATQREPLELDANQRAYATTRTASGSRRIKGPAGSGKSQVLAARAAQLASEGKEVLVVTFNITLIRYLRDLAVRWPRPYGNLENITLLNFHSWCKRFCQEHNYEQEYKQLWVEYHQQREEFFNYDGDAPDKDNLLNHQLSKLVSSIIDNDTPEHIKHYDAVLVDEGQDFRLKWWNVLRKICKEEGEMLLVADKTQDIYGTASAWTDDAMKTAGFRGPWNTLPVSYRLPPKLTDYARSFAEAFLPRELVDLPISPQTEIDFHPCQLRWVQTQEAREIECCVQEIHEMLLQEEPEILAIPDITFLVDRKDIGRKVTEALGRKGIKFVHTFDEDSKESRRQKLSFHMRDARVKATTLHSFKGLETRALVVYTGHIFNDKAKALAYTGMTRLKRHQKTSFLTIVSAIPEFAEYGKTWQYHNAI
jgi:superfamily I DNA/RNA helicase